MKPPAFIAALSGSQEYIADYLADEVLKNRTEAARSFLLHTAILDQFSADLCEVVTGINNSRQILGQLRQANLFLTPLDEEQC